MEFRLDLREKSKGGRGGGKERIREVRKSDERVGIIRISIGTCINISIGIYFGSISISILISCIYPEQRFVSLMFAPHL